MFSTPLIFRTEEHAVFFYLDFFSVILLLYLLYLLYRNVMRSMSADTMVGYIGIEITHHNIVANLSDWILNKASFATLRISTRTPCYFKITANREGRVCQSYHGSSDITTTVVHRRNSTHSQSLG
jgi:hypothetical protein